MNGLQERLLWPGPVIWHVAEMTSKQTRSAQAPKGPRFLVIQSGARHRYAIPAAFQRAGALAGVYTDVVSTQGAGAVLSKIASAGTNLAEVLERRTPPSELADKISDSGSAFLAARAVTAVAGGAAGARVYDRIAGRQMAIRGTQGATHIYTMFGEGGGFLKRAKEAGLAVVGDVYIALSANQIVAEEAAHFPDWADAVPALTSAEERIALNKGLLAFSDLLLCASDFVRDDLVKHGINPRRTVVVPYAVSPRWLSLPVNPEAGRVLFAGTASLRKGIHYLAAAAALLKGRCRVRIAGDVPEAVRRHPQASELEFLGHLGPSRMAEEFGRADVFAFPSLAEGSAGVTAEALGAGVPVVTTRAAGSIVRDRIDGYIVPERDAEALANMICSIVDNRQERTAMSLAARQRAQSVTWDGFAASVIAATTAARSGINSNDGQGAWINSR